MTVIKVTYSLSPEGRKADLLSGGDGKKDKILMVQDPDNILLKRPEVSVNDYGQASIDIGWKLVNWAVDWEFTGGGGWIIYPQVYEKAMEICGDLLGEKEELTGRLADGGSFLPRRYKAQRNGQYQWFDKPITGLGEILDMFAANDREKTECEVKAAAMQAYEDSLIEKAMRVFRQLEIYGRLRREVEAVLSKEYQEKTAEARKEVEAKDKQVEELTDQVESLTRRVAELAYQVSDLS